MKKISISFIFIFILLLSISGNISDKKEINAEKTNFIDYTSQFQLEKDYKNKSFINDGIGEVTIEELGDGDTTVFRDKVTLETFRLRYLGIDTPETHPEAQPFGLEAKEFTNNLLKNAKTIVISSTGDHAEKGTYGRYLGLVWVDGMSLNLEIILNGYSQTGSLADLPEEQNLIFMKALAQAREYKLNYFSI